MEAPLHEEMVMRLTQRWTEIDSQLRAMGWEPNDMDIPNSWSTKQEEWEALVEKPRSDDDQDWEDLVPQLASLLEINHNERLQFESETRQQARAKRLDALMDMIKFGDFAMVRFNVIPQFLSSGADPSASATYQAPFPDFNETLEWTVLKRLHENDVSLLEMDEGFQHHEKEIMTQVIEWQFRIHQYFLDLLRAGRQTLQPATGIYNPNLPDGLKVLLRADVLFCNLASRNRVQRKTPLTYGMLSLWGFSSVIGAPGVLERKSWASLSWSSCLVPRGSKGYASTANKHRYPQRVLSRDAELWGEFGLWEVS
ncbi:unnamed protein product [Rhizoctonia solani]|uniref:Uncharacterized protein n=1 Tax=Rhizoctonia solani TaxID=456999 RepID=A0A8H3C5D7_9AGAM|nr:unnamed protein product [Rhizoctonia solani]